MLVVGATGYIGKFVVRELVKRGYDVVALARERSGVGGKATRDDVQRVRASANQILTLFQSPKRRRCTPCYWHHRCCLEDTLGQAACY